jgi:sec-independent protein translocase protein TatA
VLVCAGVFSLGVPELAVMAGGVETLSFSPRKLPEIGKGFGKTVKSFSQVKNPLPPPKVYYCVSCLKPCKTIELLNFCCICT